MATINHNAFADEDARFDKLCTKGMRKEKAARLAHASHHHIARKGSYSKYEKWTTDALYKKAVDEGIEGAAHMSKRALICALQEH